MLTSEAIKKIVSRAVRSAMDDTTVLISGFGVMSVTQLLDKLATGEIRIQKNGYWVEEPDRARHWHCSECGTVQGVTAMAMNYCPECGARMEDDSNA